MISKLFECPPALGAFFPKAGADGVGVCCVMLGPNNFYCLQAGVVVMAFKIALDTLVIMMDQMVVKEVG